MEIEFKVIAPDKAALERQAWNALRRQTVQLLESKLAGIRCSQHRQRPRVIVRGSLENPEFIIEGCCQELIDQAAEALK